MNLLGKLGTPDEREHFSEEKGVGPCNKKGVLPRLLLPRC